MKILVWIFAAILVALTVFMLFTAGWERPPIDTNQTGFRGTGMVEVSNPRIANPLLEAQLAAVPESTPLPPDGPGPTAGDIYQNVQLLGDLSIAQFTRLMQAWTEWVSPEQGCAYCHQLDNLAADTVYTKVVSRRMLQMTQTVNVDWGTHVAETGVTCYTCHRGKNVPEYAWFNTDPANDSGGGMLGWTAGQNRPAEDIGLTSLPVDPFSDLIEGDDSIRIVGRTALPEGQPIGSMQETERTYALMIHMSEALNVNCTYCHNTRNFSTWDQSPPQRVTSWYGLEMTRALNVEYVSPLSSVFPPHRLGPTGESRKINCETCHQGVNKPLGGLAMAKDYPAHQVRTGSSMGALEVADLEALANAEAGDEVEEEVLVEL
ncbi:MAG: photosynthetic reaction center cytochrome PufC [Wenzhouxiangella sp.]|nr:photosynthetic reaction center cytochrome PufC [Wenzhouxiangella sp.]